MRLVIQRVTSASVSIDGEIVGKIVGGLLVLVGVREGDTEADMKWLAQKTVNMRIFDDENGVMNRSVIDAGGEVLSISQFTLNASTKKGNRPSYIHAAGHDLAVPLYGVLRGSEPPDGQGCAAWQIRRRYAGVARQRRPRYHHHRLAFKRVMC